MTREYYEEYYWSSHVLFTP